MFDIETCLVFMTGNAYKKLSNNFNKSMAKKGCTRVQWLALYFIGREGLINQTKLAKLMQISTSTLVRLLDRMEKAGYVFREKDAADKRVTYVSLTEKGRNMMVELIKEVDTFSAKITGNISEDEVKIFSNVLNKMIVNITK